MLNIDSIDAARPLTDVLDGRGLVLYPVAGSPLETVVNATRVDVSMMLPDAGGQGYHPDVALIHTMTSMNDEVLGANPHDAAFDTLVEMVSKSITEHIVFAKNVVSPAVEELVKRTVEAMRSVTAESLLGMEIKTYYPPKPLLVQSLQDEVSAFSTLAVDNPKMNLKLPDLTGTEIIELMKTGSGNLDKAVAEWAATLGDSFFVTVWENIFQIKFNRPENESKTFNDYIYQSDKAIDYALAIYLLARRLYEAPLPNTEMPLDMFNTTIIEYRNQAGGRICRFLTDLDTIDKGQILVRNVSGPVTTVNGLVYEKWLAAGGENEVLFGNTLIDRKIIAVPQMLERAQELKDLWNHHQLLTATVERNRAFTRTKETLKKQFVAIMYELKEGDDSIEANRQMVISKFDELLDTVRENELKDLWAVCLRLVCESRFSKTDAYKILTGIDRIKEENPNVDVREAASVSTLEYINHWFSSQMRVVSVGQKV